MFHHFLHLWTAVCCFAVFYMFTTTLVSCQNFFYHRFNNIYIAYFIFKFWYIVVGFFFGGGGLKEMGFFHYDIIILKIFSYYELASQIVLNGGHYVKLFLYWVEFKIVCCFCLIHVAVFRVKISMNFLLSYSWTIILKYLSFLTTCP